MKNRISKLSYAIGASMIFVSSWAAAAEFRVNSNPVEGQYIVVLKKQAASLASEVRPMARVGSVANDIAATHRARIVHTFEHALRGFVVKADDDALAKLLADPRVEYVEEDGYVSMSPAYQTNPPSWGIDRVDQRTLPLNNLYAFTYIGAGVRAYVLDTGINATHNEFRQWTGGLPYRIGNGFSSIADGRGTADCHGHGTHVAGTLGGATMGAARGVTIHPVRVLDCLGNGTFAGVIAGMDWVTANRVRPAVANMSLGGGASQAIDDAVARMTAAGVTVVVAAGNAASNACNFSPARAPSAITVASTDINDARSSFSNYGTCVDIFAPGRNIVSAWYTSNTATATLSGTSMASPHVAAAVAIYLGTEPSASPARATSDVLSNATPNVVTNPGAGSPNRMVYVIPPYN